VTWAASPTVPSIATALTVTLAVIFGLKFFPKLPISVVALVLATLITIGLQIKLDTIPTILNPMGKLDLTFLHLFENLSEFLIPAMGIAALGAFEALLSAKIADRMAGEAVPHNSDRELVGQGLANLVVPFMGGVPATAALARTAVNVRSGATSRIAAGAHSVFLVLMVLALSPLVSLVPLPALAGVLLATAFNMVKFSELKQIALASKLDTALVTLSLALTVFVDLTTALLVGTLIWLFLRKTKLAKGENDFSV
jgi:SulP family sulfate permease